MENSSDVIRALQAFPLLLHTSSKLEIHSAPRLQMISVTGSTVSQRSHGPATLDPRQGRVADLSEMPARGSFR